MTRTLDPCPFCGVCDLRFDCRDIDGWVANVVCNSCDVVGPLSDYKHDDQEDALDDAAMAWNRRANDAAVSETSRASTELAAEYLSAFGVSKEKARAAALLLARTVGFAAPSAQQVSALGAASIARNFGNEEIRGSSDFRRGAAYASEHIAMDIEEAARVLADSEAR